MNRDFILWSTIAAGPLLWMVSFGAGWSMAWWACIWNWTPGMVAVSAAAMALTVAGAFVAWTQWRRIGQSLPGEAGGAIPRARAMAIGGVALNIGSFLVILTQIILQSMIGACQ